MSEWVEPKLLNDWNKVDESKTDEPRLAKCVICDGKTQFQDGKLSFVCGEHLTSLLEAEKELNRLRDMMKNQQLAVLKDGKIAFILPKGIHMSEGEKE